MLFTPDFLKRTLLPAWLMAGTLDILGAIVILAKGNAAGTLQFVASGLLGSEAFTGGAGVMVLGLIIHFFIAFVFTTLFFLAFQKLAFVRENLLWCSLFYGVLIWAVMKYLVLPFSYVNSPGHFEWKQAIRDMLVLCASFGAPLYLFASRYLKSSQ